MQHRWWTQGPYDVEGFALDAVSAACESARALAAARGHERAVDTTPAIVAASFAAIENLRVDGRPPSVWAPLSGFARARDGWVRLHANYPHHERALRHALGIETRDGLDRRLAATSAQDVEEAVTGAGGIAVAVRSAHEWALHPHAAATAGEPWWSVDEYGGRPAPPPTTRMPLDGVRVLDLTRVIAGPTCSQLLACLGADVLRVDPPARPELLDQHLSTGMGKRSALLDLRERRDILERLLGGADVVLLGYRPGSLDRFGLGPDDLAERHPHLVVGSLSAWGEHGPWARRPGFDSIVQAASGIGAACGDGSRPGALPVQALDHATGYRLAEQVMGLLARGRTGVARISLLGAARTLLARPAGPAGRCRPSVPLVTVESPHGVLSAVPPPVLVDGATIERPVGGYGRADAQWLRRATR